MVHAILSLVVLAAAVFAVSRWMPGVRCKDFGTALKVAVGLSVVNFVVWKLLFFITLPVAVVTGLVGIFLVNAASLWLVDEFIEDFEIKDTGTLLLASGGIALLNWALKVALPGV